MKCPECERLGLRSRVRIGSGFSTAMCGDSFYDEDGRYHNHDPNTVTWHYSCSNGHEFGRSETKRCPVADCDWNKHAAGEYYARRRAEQRNRAAADIEISGFIQSDGIIRPAEE